MVDYVFGVFMFVIGLGYGLALSYRRDSKDQPKENFVQRFYNDALDKTLPGNGVQLILTVERSKDDDDDGDDEFFVECGPSGSRWENN